MEAGCVRMWRSAQERPPEPHEARYACTTCPLGPQRAGVDVVEAVAAANAVLTERALSRVCPRCERQAVRLINGRTCVSCYNRTREATLGVNAKGTRPKIADVIHTETFTIAFGDAPPRLVAVDRVLSRVEAMGIAARQAGPGAMIGVPPLALVAP